MKKPAAPALFILACLLIIFLPLIVGAQAPPTSSSPNSSSLITPAAQAKTAPADSAKTFYQAVPENRDKILDGKKSKRQKPGDIPRLWQTEKQKMMKKFLAERKANPYV
ncbi:MAG: hypothetical protein PHO56_03500 [Patescibacteria group bacterium]|nr:hypothetical protein [Patescibacteria group bacterium]